MGTDGPAAIHIGAIESAYLQLRKILELVAFASLTANKQDFSKIYAKFSKIWHAGQLLRDLKKVNQHFYPIPLIQTPSTEPGVKWHMEERPPDYLDQTAFLLLYNRIGELMHARNPYAKPIAYDEYHEEIGDWCAKVRNLLEFHGIVLAENANRWLCAWSRRTDAFMSIPRLRRLVKRNDEGYSSQAHRTNGMRSVRMPHNMVQIRRARRSPPTARLRPRLGGQRRRPICSEAVIAEPAEPILFSAGYHATVLRHR